MLCGLYAVVLRQWCNMSDITDVYLEFSHRHWLHKHDICKADCFRLQVHYDLKNKQQYKKNQRSTNSYVRDKTIQTAKYKNSLYKTKSTSCNKIK